MPNVVSLLQWQGLRAVPFVLCATSAFAQAHPLPPTGAPPEVRQLGRLPKAPRPGNAPTADQVLRRLGITPSAEPLAASTVEPPDVAALRRMTTHRDTSTPPRPSAKELLEIIRQQTGGAATIERARRAGARLPPDGDKDIEETSATQGVSGLANGVGEFSASVPASAATLTATVTRTARIQTVAGLGTLEAEAFFPLFANDDPYWEPLNPIPHPDVPSSPVGAAYDVKPYISISLNAAADGWYIISVSASQTAAEARRYVSPTYQLVQSFPLPTTPGVQSYPFLLQLAAGHHYFAWRSLGPSVGVVAVTVIKL